MECLNEACRDNRNHRCYNLLNTMNGCNNAIKPTYTPSYAEEQLKNAIKNELKTIKARTKELVAENEKLREENKDYQSANISLGKFRVLLEEKLIVQKDEIEYIKNKLLDYENEINNLQSKNKELYNGLNYANTKLEESYSNSDLIEIENENLKQIVKKLSEIL